MPTPALHLLCAKLGLKGYEPGFLTSPEAPDVSGFGRIILARVFGIDHGARCVPTGLTVPFGFVSATLDPMDPVRPEKNAICTLRGTQMPDGSWVEWMDDFKAWLEACPFAPFAKWHYGMGQVYRTLYAVDRAGNVWKLSDYLAFLDANGGVQVHGHSLGAPLATYAAMEAKLVAPPILFASPKPGDALFRQDAGTLWEVIPSYYNPNDAVPKVPITVNRPWKFEDFQQVAPFIELNPDSVNPPIPADWDSSHQLCNYVSLMEVAA